MLEHLITHFKSNKLSQIGGVLTFVGMIVTGIWAVDARYAKAAEVNHVQRKVEQSTQDMSLELQIRLNEQAIRTWQDRIDDLEDQPRLTEGQKNQKRRWQRQVDDLKKENEQLKRQQFELRKPQ